MDKQKAEELISSLCQEVYKTEHGVCLVLVGVGNEDGVQCSIQGVAHNVYDLDEMVEVVQRYQAEQHAAIDENGIPHLTGIKIDEEGEKEIDNGVQNY